MPARVRSINERRSSETMANLQLDGGFDALKDLTQLRQLTLMMTSVSDVEIDALEDALPDTTIQVISGGASRLSKKMRNAREKPAE